MNVAFNIVYEIVALPYFSTGYRLFVGFVIGSSGTGYVGV